MQHNHPYIAYSYHFLSEAIILFLVAIPVLYHRFFFIPYASYLIVVVGACALFILITKWSSNIYSYFLVVPILFILFHVLNYPIFFSIVFSGVLTWRFIDIRKQKIIKRESLYILLTVLATIFASLFVHEREIMFYPFLVFSILFFGFVLSHFIYSAKDDIRKINYKVPLYFLSLLIGGAAIFFILFQPISYFTTMIWRGVLNGVESVLFGMSNLLSYLNVEKRTWSDNHQESDGGDASIEKAGEIIEGPSLMDQITGLAVFGISLILLFVIILIIAMMVKRRVVKHFEKVEYKEQLSVKVIESSIASNQEWKTEKGIKRFFKSPEHPIRKLLLQFERKAKKHNKGRLPFETLEDWFARIGLSPEHIKVYQKVRYGDQNVSVEDTNMLKEQLNNMERHIIKG